MAPTISQEPAAPRSTIDGVFLIVTGEVAVPSHLSIRDADGVERGVSPVFKQGMNPRVTNAVVLLESTGSGGTFALAAREVGSDEEEYNYSDGISYDYTDDDVAAALQRVMPSGSIVEASTEDGTTTLTLRGTAKERPWIVVADDADLTGGSASVTEDTAGGEMDYVPSGPFRFGAMVLDEDRASIVYLYADEDGTDSEDNEITEGDVLDTLTLTFA